MNLKPILVLFALVCLVSVQGCDMLKKSDMPEGAVEYVETANGSITVYEDAVVAEGEGIPGGEMEIEIEKITRVKKWGHYVKIYSKDGSEVQLTGLTNSTAKKLKTAIDELKEE